MLSTVQAILLAAGKSTRFNTNKTKLTEKICGQPMILYQTTLLQALAIPITLVVGHYKEILQSIVSAHHKETVDFITQQTAQGTGDAVKCTQPLWHKEHILIMNGDIPLITEDIITALYAKHISSNAALTFVTAHDSNPTSSYGRVVHTDKGIEIIEAKHLTNLQDYCCVNAGIYLAKRTFLEKYINTVSCNPVTGEYYLTELITIAAQNNEIVETITAPFDTVRGVNTLEELWAAEQVKRSELIRMWMEKGVRFSTAQNVHIDLGVTIGAGSYIGCGVHLTGSTHIGNNCTIHAFSLLENSTLHNNVTVYSHSVITNTVIETAADVGPFAHLRNNTVIGKEANIGNFVEIKNSTIGKQTKARHLSYLGDATIGAHVNIGAGTITANYDGYHKQPTRIHDGASIGANTSIVAPLTINQGAYTAAGSTLTQDVPAHALAIARSRQINKEEYAFTLKEKKKTSVQKKKVNSNPDESDTQFTGAIKITNPQMPSPE